MRMRIGFMRMRIGFMCMKCRIKTFVHTQFMPWTCMNWAWIGHELCMKLLWLWAWKAWNMGQNSQISWVLLGKIYCVLSMNMGMYMPKNHELFLPGWQGFDWWKLHRDWIIGSKDTNSWRIEQTIRNKRNYRLCLAVFQKQYLQVPTHFAWSHRKWTFKCPQILQFHIVSYIVTGRPLTW